MHTLTQFTGYCYTGCFYRAYTVKAHQALERNLLEQMTASVLVLIPSVSILNLLPNLPAEPYSALIQATASQKHRQKLGFTQSLRTLYQAFFVGALPFR